MDSQDQSQPTTVGPRKARPSQAACAGPVAAVAALEAAIAALEAADPGEVEDLLPAITKADHRLLRLRSTVREDCADARAKRLSAFNQRHPEHAL